ncbi:hypothetical protein HBB16_10330 [Pseudonocardia sp. MCCB 268]|nr:hypothetical protein [Pseudonocardia cytotoxica]
MKRGGDPPPDPAEPEQADVVCLHPAAGSRRGVTGSSSRRRGPRRGSRADLAGQRHDHGDRVRRDR